MRSAPIRLLVSVVAYQAAELTIACLASIEPELASMPGTRVIVVDNASPDGAAEPVERAIAEHGWGAWATLIRAPYNGGFAAGNNIALRLLSAEADYALLLNPDTLVRPGALRVLVDFLDAHPEVGIAGGRSEDLDSTPQMCCFRFPSSTSEVLDRLSLGLLERVFERRVVRLGIPEQAMQVDWVSGAFMLVRRAVIERIGLMDEGYFLYFEETDFTLRARRAGWTCWHVPQARIVHLVGQSSGVTVREGAVRRLPAYWFESRRRYFVLNHGRAYAALTDLLVLATDPVGRLRHWLQRKPKRRPPHYWRDLACHSAVWRGVSPRCGADLL